jgi:16S rRNA (guanine1516-N2)-methyltransferase
VHIWLQPDQKEDLLRGEKLAERFDLNAAAGLSVKMRYNLTYFDGRLLLYFQSGEKMYGPVQIDFLSERTLYRFRTDTSIRQPLAKAAGLKKGWRPRICDATAGFGTDGFTLAALGCRVHLVERSFPIWLLLEDALRRAAKHPIIGPICEKNITVVHDDARIFLASSALVFDTVYLDPMYPQKKKSALNRQELRYLKNIVGADPDSRELLEAARKYGRKRCVVKRPAAADSIAATPDFFVTGKSTRYDIYLCSNSPSS